MIEKNARIKYYRLYKKMRSTFDVLHKHGRIDDETKADWVKVCESLYADWRREMREARKPYLKRPGRPRTVIDRNVLHPNCAREGCKNKSAAGQIYCSKTCAPLGNYGRGWLSGAKCRA